MRDLYLIILIIVAGCLLFAIASRVRFARLGAKRRALGSGYESFRKELGDRISAEICQAVYDYFYDISGRRLPVLASDDLGDIYGIVDDDLVFELRELAVKCRVAAPTPDAVFMVSNVLEAALLMESLRPDTEPEPGSALCS